MMNNQNQNQKLKNSLGSYTVAVPIAVEIGKKKKRKFTLNLNTYRNLHYHVESDIKVKFQNEIKDVIEPLPIFQRISLHYKYFPRCKRKKQDLMNPVAIVDKYFEDCLVHYGKIEDDSHQFIVGLSASFGEADPKNPRMEITIKEE